MKCHAYDPAAGYAPPPPCHTGHPEAASQHGGTAFTGPGVDVGAASILGLTLALVGGGIVKAYRRDRRIPEGALREGTADGWRTYALRRWHPGYWWARRP